MMKTLKIFFITLLFSLSIVFVVYPNIVFANNNVSIVSNISKSFPVLFILAFISSVILAILVYFVEKILNRK